MTRKSNHHADSCLPRGDRLAAEQEQRNFAICGLQYIALSPLRAQGGFHEQTVEIAKEALKLIQRLE